MSICPYLFFNGEARAALTFYGEVFGVAPAILDASGMPPDTPVPEDRKDWVMHGNLNIAGGMLMASDAVFEPTQPMAGASINVSLPTVEEAKPIFDKLAEGGQITMPWAATFWTPGFGTLTDKFGIRWMVGVEPAPSAG